MLRLQEVKVSIVKKMRRSTVKFHAMQTKYFWLFQEKHQKCQKESISLSSPLASLWYMVKGIKPLA